MSHKSLARAHSGAPLRVRFSAGSREQYDFVEELLGLCIEQSARDGDTTASDVIFKVDAYYSKSISGRFGNVRNCFRVLPQGKILYLKLIVV